MINKANFISKFKELKTPFYFYNTEILKNTLSSLSKSILPNNLTLSKMSHTYINYYRIMGGQINTLYQ